jgi:hypothetical protein
MLFLIKSERKKKFDNLIKQKINNTKENIKFYPIFCKNKEKKNKKMKN